MHIAEIFRKEYIIEDLKARSKRGVLTELSGIFSPGSVKVDPKLMVDVLMEREKLGSTGIGDGIAIPHGKLKGLDTLLLSFGRSRDGVDFESIDGKPVHLFFLLMAPESSTGQHLKALAKISRMLKDEHFRSELMSAQSAEDLYKAIVEKDETY
ncbi:MAG TPA: PTS sugar transporter subunit IIA [Syntrophales bacterium]|nr:PTS sugar transporter subunit IIA [Syntrophales bacterium]HOX95111.1 PTS sugar transporter subunit IIA [Syntrophales bacterium]HPI55843.1 PTS sugar transporter subunit IIA [Syntrophales bacterium]HPN23666.1 PTS sugar transporter subunit IIA [Syntrophales bacterium]HQM27809.1 PTS sugar transporter subunit IIA [Syntrophales bacterium]